MILTIVGVVSVVLGLGGNSLKLWNNLPGAELEPFSGEWAEACADHFKSFDPRSGYWVDLNGKRRFCRMVRRRVDVEVTP